MKRILGALLLALTTAALGQEAPFPRTDEAEQKIAELDKCPVAAEYRDLQKAIEDIYAVPNKQAQEIREKLNALQRSEAYRDYLKKRDELADKRRDAWSVERQAMAEAAKALYSARHEEIRKAARPELPEAAKLGLSLVDYPKVDGSTSTQPLSIIMACRLLGSPYEWSYPEPSGNLWANNWQPEELRHAMFGAYRAPDTEFYLSTLRVYAKSEKGRDERTAMLVNGYLAANASTHQGYVNLIEGKSDLNLTAREPSESELKLAKEKGVAIELEPIARDAFVMIVNHQNPVKSLTSRQVRDIYEGRTTDWGDLGGAKGPIAAYRRERDSGSRELFDRLVMRDETKPEDDRVRMLYSFGMGGPYSQLTRDPAGLGYSVYYYEHFMAASPRTRVLAIDGVEPTAENIASGKYPWTTKVYVAYRADAKPDGPTMKLVRWLLSPEGQGVVRESGYVPEMAR